MCVLMWWWGVGGWVSPPTHTQHTQTLNYMLLHEPTAECVCAKTHAGKHNGSFGVDTGGS